MKSLSDMKEDAKSDDTLLDDKSPLIECSPPFQNGRSSFDNFAMATDSDSLERTDVEDGGSDRNASLVDSTSSITSQEVADSRASNSDDQSGRHEDGEEGRKRRPKLRIVSRE